MIFSIITVVRNRVITIDESISSVARQSFTGFEHLIQDSCSTDGTLGRLLVRSAKDSRIEFVSEKDTGIYDGLNRGIARASGDVIGILHSDDFYAHDNVLSDVARCFDETGADAVYGDLDYVSAAEPERVVRRWRSGLYNRRKLSLGWMPPHPTLFIRRSIMKRWGGYDTTYRIAADYDLILRYFGQAHIRSAYLPQVLVKMRLGGESNRSLSRITRKSIEDYRALRQNSVGGLAALMMKNLSKIGQFLPERTT